jgi:asparagine synthase (glutamine-hydrolysing)
MCGIAGFSGRADAALLRRMTDIISHRGPDAEGQLAVDGANLGNRRLSIIDLAGGNQPIANEDETVWIVYNGELYNHPELRAELESKGHVYRTNTDTETLLHLYEEEGDSFAARLNGIFAFAIWDSRERRLVLGRDHFGIKPLHYAMVNGELVFGSEIKSLLLYPGMPRELNHQALHLFLNIRYMPHADTLFAGIHRLPAAHVLVWQDGRADVRRYWSSEVAIDHGRDEAYWIDGLRHHLEQAVQRQLVSDVPLGLYLSGGMDSSAIVAMATAQRGAGLHTFSLGFNEPTDEVEDAAFVADHFQTDHHTLSVNAEPLRMFPEVIWHAEEPKENILQGFLLARHARQHVTVALSGLGGDELFAGYQVHRYLRLGQRLHACVPGLLNRALLTPLSRLLFAAQSATGTLQFDHHRRALQLLLASGDPTRFYTMLRNTWDIDRGQLAAVYGDRMRAALEASVADSFSPYFERPGLS